MKIKFEFLTLVTFWNLLAVKQSLENYSNWIGFTNSFLKKILKSWKVDRAMRSDPTKPLESIFGSDIPLGQALDIDEVIKLTSGSLSKS